MERAQDVMRTRPVLVLLAVVAVALLGAVSTARAEPTDNAICRPFVVGGQKVAWEVIGTWTCATAKPWILKMDGDHVSQQLGKAALHNGPRGYHCFATRETAKGRVIDGICYAGTLAYPKTGFVW